MISKPPALEDALLALLRGSDDEEVRLGVAHALNNYSCPEGGIEVATLLLEDGASEDVRLQAVAMLGKVRSRKEEAAAALLECIGTEHGTVREWSIVALGWLRAGARCGTGILLKMAKDEGESTKARQLAIGSLSLINPRDADVWEQLVELLSDEDVDLRRETARCLALGGADSKPVVAALCACLEREKAVTVKREVLFSLGRIGCIAPQELDAIVRIFEEDPECRLQAAYALCRLSKSHREKALNFLVGELIQADAQGRQYAMLRLLGDLGPTAKGAASTVAGFLNAQEKPIRLRAIQTLGMIGDVDDSSYLEALLGDADMDVQNAAQHALKALRRPEPESGLAPPR